MGLSSLADALTGLAIPRGEPIVALAVERRTGGYPDATTHAAMSGHSPSQAFEPVSMPIRGKAGDYGDIEPGRGDLGAALLMDLAGKKDWEAFSREAFGVNAGISLGPTARGEKPGFMANPADDVPRVLGLVVFNRSSWDRIVALGTAKLDREVDVATVMEALAQVRAATVAGNNDIMAMNLGLTELSSSCLYVKDPAAERGIRSTRLPALARALGGREGGELVSGLATQGLKRRGGVLGYHMLDAEPDPRLPELLGLVWDLQAAERGMDVLCRTWQPSYGAGQYDNSREVAAGALETFSEAAGHLLGRLEEGYGDEEEAVPEIEAMMARLDALRASLGERLDAARASMAPGP